MLGAVKWPNVHLSLPQSNVRIHIPEWMVASVCQRFIPTKKKSDFSTSAPQARHGSNQETRSPHHEWTAFDSDGFGNIKEAVKIIPQEVQHPWGREEQLCRDGLPPWLDSCRLFHSHWCFVFTWYIYFLHFIRAQGKISSALTSPSVIQFDGNLSVPPSTPVGMM